MEVGVVTFATHRGLPPGALAMEVEARGLDALFVTEHTHMPLAHGPTPWGEPPGPEYGCTFDPLVTLGIAANVTTSITIGTAVCLVAQHDPIALAKAVATVDHLSGGRVVLGVGFGWCRLEVEDHGVSFSARRDAVAEHVGAMRALWSAEPTPFEGPTTRFGPANAFPKPQGAGRPTVLLGAPPSATTTEHLIRWADGWMPSDRPSLVEDLRQLRIRLEQAGRDPQRFDVTVVGVAVTVERLDALAGAGVGCVLAWLPPGPPQAVLDALDEVATLRASASGEPSS